MTWSQKVVRHLAIASIVIVTVAFIMFVTGITGAAAFMTTGSLAFGIWLAAGVMWLFDPDTDLNGLL